MEQTPDEAPAPTVAAPIHDDRRPQRGLQSVGGSHQPSKGKSAGMEYKRKDRCLISEEEFPFLMDKALVEQYKVTCEIIKVDNTMQQLLQAQVAPGWQLTGVPLFVAKKLAKAGFLRIIVPEIFGQTVQDKVRTAPETTNLYELHPRYYTLGANVNDIVGDKILGDFLQTTFQTRLEKLLLKSVHEKTWVLEGKMSEEERRIYWEWRKVWKDYDHGR